MIPRSLATERMRPGSEWHELVIRASLAAPERWAGPAHGALERWDFGVTGRSLFEAFSRHDRLSKFAAGMTPEQHDLVWSDPSPEAQALRRVMR